MSLFGKYLPEIVDNFQAKRKTVAWWRRFKQNRVERVQEILDYYKDNEQFKSEMAYLKTYGADYFPYDWARNKNVWKIRCGGKFNNPQRERYVIRNGKKLFLSLTSYSQLSFEQHPESPHAYFSTEFYVEPTDCFVDIGAAEGMISLDIIDKAERCILIECNEKWHHSLRKTFEPYRNKVQIVSKYVSDKNDENNITLDELLKDVKNPVVLKIDVEGMEDQVLAGAQEVLRRKDTKVAICTYHKPGDDIRFKEYFEKLGYWTEMSEGYMTMLNGEEPPYFRKAMLRAKKYKQAERIMNE